MIDLPHVASRVFGTPLLIARPKLETILGVLGPRLRGEVPAPVEFEADPPPRTSITVERIAVVSVIGTLVSRSGYLDATSGLSSYADIGDAIAGVMADPSVRGVVLDVDSAGGEVGGLFDLVERIGAIKAEAAKPLWAVANETALSAAYAVASAADRLYVTRTGEAGSVGVVAVHVDGSGADAKAGLAWTFVFAGERKVDANAHAPLSARARADIQADVDRLYAQLCASVAANRRLSPEAVRRTEAANFRGELAIRAGLADRIGTLDLAIANMAQEVESTAIGAPRQKIGTLNRSLAMTDRETSNPADDGPKRPAPDAPTDPKREPEQPSGAPVPQTPAPASPPGAPAPPPLPPAHDPAERYRAEYAEIAEVAAQAARLGVAIDAADAMRKAVKPDALRRTVLDTLAERSAAADVVSAAPAAGAKVSPIVKRARDRAAAARS